MNIAEKAAKLETDLNAANAQIKELQATISNAEAAKTTAVTEATATANGKVTKAEKDLSDEKSSHEATKGALKTANDTIATLKAEAKTASDRAVEIAAANGTNHVEGADKNQSTSSSGETVHQQFAKISDANERAKFYQKHQAELLK